MINWKEKFSKSEFFLEKANNDSFLNHNVLGIVAVGDFLKIDVACLIEKYFSNLVKNTSLNKNKQLSNHQINVKCCPGASDANLDFIFFSNQGFVKKIQDLKTQLIDVLFQSMFQKRIETKLQEENLVNHMAPPAFMIPAACYGIQTKCPVPEVLTTLEKILSEVEYLNKNGFTLEEFLNAKEKFKTGLETLLLNEQSYNNTAIASYYADHFLNNAAIIPYHFFLESSLSFLEHISLKEISDRIYINLKNQNRCINLCCPDEFFILSQLLK